MKPAITLTGISKAFPGSAESKVMALRDVSLKIEQGEFFMFVGPSGCGKSTILRIMSGLEKSFQGTVELAPGITKKDFSFVFQQFALLPWMTVEENVELGLLTRKVPREERNKIVRKELRQFGLERFAKQYPRDLSGGMRQRVGIARAFATNPKIMFLDEPFSELDSFTAEELRKELLMIWKDRRPTIIMVTHIVEEALELADRIAVMTPRPGKLEKIVPVKLSRPRQKRAKEFFTLEDKLYQLIRP